MFIKNYENILYNERGATIELPSIIKKMDNEIELSQYEISGTGKIEITNTGGSSASEGGMGTGGGQEKGAGIPGKEGGDKEKGSKEEADGTWDPLKPKEEKGKEKS